MNIEPRVPQSTADNSRGRSTPRKWLRDVLLVTAFFVGLYLLLGLIANLLVAFMPRSWEAELAVEAEMLGPLQSDPDPRLQTLFDNIAATAGTPGKLELIVLNVPEVNAYALPGGQVILTSGFLAEAESEQELAFVIGHELGHLDHRHGLKRMGRRLVFSVTMAVLFGVSPDGLKTLDWIQTQAYSRGQEREADRYGIEAVAAQYGHVGGSLAFFKRIKRGQIALISTHPLPSQRIRDLAELIRKRGWAEHGPSPW